MSFDSNSEVVSKDVAESRWEPTFRALLEDRLGATRLYPHLGTLA